VIIDGWVNLPRAAAGASPELKAVTSFFGAGDGMLREQTAETLVAAMDEVGVDGAMLLTGLPFRVDGMALPFCSLDEGLAALDVGGDRLRLMLNIPGVRDLVATNRLLRELAADGRVKAVCVSGASLGIELTDRRLYAIYATLADVGLALVCNVGIFGPPRPSKYQHPLLLEEICADFPELTVVAAHMGHPWEDLLVRLMMKFPNLYLMSSAYLPKYLDPAVLQFMASRRGTGKVCFASDHPLLEMGRCLTEARKLGLDDDVLRGYLGDNLAAALRW
jgi:predicted TIM-barrel fold metal-dependent hydrolase